MVVAVVVVAVSWAAAPLGPMTSATPRACARQFLFFLFSFFKKKLLRESQRGGAMSFLPPPFFCHRRIAKKTMAMAYSEVIAIVGAGAGLMKHLASDGAAGSLMKRMSSNQKVAAAA
jgi:hypothetical protein